MHGNGIQRVAGCLIRIDAIVISTQHDDDVDQEKIREDILKVLIPRVKKQLDAQGIVERVRRMVEASGARAELNPASARSTA